MFETILVYTTFEEKEDALKLGRYLLEQRLVACAQLDPPLDSLYWWNGKIEQTKEYRLVMKSSLSLWKDLEQAILGKHSYDTPEIIAIPVFATSEKYHKWLQKELRE